MLSTVKISWYLATLWVRIYVAISLTCSSQLTGFCASHTEVYAADERMKKALGLVTSSMHQ